MGRWTAVGLDRAVRVRDRRAEREREKQETREVALCAVTRARDRLYLSSVLKEGVLVPGRGSLAEVLPESLKQLFTHAATSFDECSLAGWAGTSGRPFDWRDLPGPLGDSRYRRRDSVVVERRSPRPRAGSIWSGA